MAYPFRKIDPIDIEGRKIVGVRFPFSAANVFTPTYQTKDAIKSNLLLYFSTSTGDRYMNPGFGFDLRDQLFEDLTEHRIQFIKTIIQRDLAVYFPIVVVRKLNVEEIAEHTLQVYLEYSLEYRDTVDELVVNLSRGNEN